MHAAAAHAAIANKEMRVSPLYYDRGQQVAHSAGLWDAVSIILYLIGDAASRRGLCTGRVFHPVQRPVERAPA